jgi:hypothetical protein
MRNIFGQLLVAILLHVKPNQSSGICKTIIFLFLNRILAREGILDKQPDNQKIIYRLTKTWNW